MRRELYQDVRPDGALRTVPVGMRIVTMGIGAPAAVFPPPVREDPVREQTTAHLGFVALGSATLVAAAVVLEVVGGTAANSTVPAWARYAFPLAWPQALRVVWWLLVAAAALSFRLALHRLGFRQRRLLVAASVMPFVLFSAGIAIGSEWTTWH